MWTFRSRDRKPGWAECPRCDCGFLAAWTRSQLEFPLLRFANRPPTKPSCDATGAGPGHQHGRQSPSLPAGRELGIRAAEGGPARLSPNAGIRKRIRWGSDWKALESRIATVCVAWQMNSPRPTVKATALMPPSLHPKAFQFAFKIGPRELAPLTSKDRHHDSATQHLLEILLRNSRLGSRTLVAHRVGN